MTILIDKEKLIHDLIQILHDDVCAPYGHLDPYYVFKVINEQPDHIAEVNKKASYSCGQENDPISRQAAINALECVGYDFSESGLSNLELEEVCEAVGEVRDDMVKRIRHLPSAQPEQRWIPLGRPMNSGRYLVTLRQKFEGEESYRVRIMRLNNGRWVLPKHFPEWINEEMEQEVLAWQPLPEPYREEGEADG